MATSIMESWVLKYPNIDGVFGHDDTLAVGAADAAKAAGITDIVIIGIGGSGEGLAAVKSGDLYGTNLQSPVEDAKLAMEKAVAIANGEEVKDFFYYIPIPKVTMENVDQFEPEGSTLIVSENLMTINGLIYLRGFYSIMIDERPLWAARLYTSTKFSEKENPKKRLILFSNQERETLRTWQNTLQNFPAVPLKMKKILYRHNVLNRSGH